MSRPDRESLRVVIQHAVEKSPRRSSYRLTAYGDRKTYRSVHFGDLAHLLKTLATALPTFDAGSLSKQEHTVETAIVFADAMELDVEQLSLLGLKD